MTSLLKRLAVWYLLWSEPCNEPDAYKHERFRLERLVQKLEDDKRRLKREIARLRLSFQVIWPPPEI